MSKIELEIINIENPNNLNFIFGQSHFIKTVEDLYETIIQTGISIKFGIAFCEVCIFNFIIFFFFFKGFG